METTFLYIVVVSSDTCDEEEGCTSVLEHFRVQIDFKNLTKGDACTEMWKDGIMYPATFVLSGILLCKHQKVFDVLAIKVAV